MMASHLDVVRTLLEYKADINAKDKVRNQMMMTKMLIIVLTIMMMMMVMMMMMMIEMIVDNDDGRSMYW